MAEKVIARNEVPNPRFRDGDGDGKPENWTYSSARFDVTVLAGGGCEVAALADETTGGGPEIQTYGIPASSGQDVAMGVRISQGSTPTGSSFRLLILCYGDSGYLGTAGSAYTSGALDGSEIVASGVTPDGTTDVRLAIYQNGAETWFAGESIQVDFARAEFASSFSAEFFHGDTADTREARFRWEGTKYDSPSIMVEREPERVVVRPPNRDGWRYIAQRAVTNDFLHWDVPIDLSELRWDLSGPGALRGAVAPDVGDLRDEDGRLILEPWGTLIYAEEGGSIRWGGIVQYSKFKGAAWEVEAAGFTSYPHGIPFTGRIRGSDLDPAEIFRDVWAHVQSFPEGDLGVSVDSTTTSTRVGSPGKTEVQAEDGSWVPLSFYGGDIPDDANTRTVNADPYSLAWWEAKDCGSELDDLAGDGGFEYEEKHFWDGDSIRHRVAIGHPRLGRRRDDLVFIQGDNIVNLVEPQGWEEFANEVIGIGAGEGISSRRTRTPIRDGRLRRPIVYTDKGVRNQSRLTRLAKRELDLHRPELAIDKITVEQHPNAQIGSWAVGDDILVQANLPWVGDVALWHRITSWALKSDTKAELSLARSSSFNYGG